MNQKISEYRILVYFKVDSIYSYNLLEFIIVHLYKLRFPIVLCLNGQSRFV